MDLSGESLAGIRTRLSQVRSERALRRLADALRGDRRSGARALAARADRRLAEAGSDRRRVARLFALRRRLLRQGARRVAGVDEVGVGPLAGPVVACALVLPERVELPGLDDSKRLAAHAREDLAARIRDQAVALSLASVPPREIDALNIYRARCEAIRRAVAGLRVAPDHVLVDGGEIPALGARQTALVGGDRLDGSIAAASIVAKVYRDALMRRLDERFPGYGFARHKGYATREHLEALQRLGPCPLHRRSFAPVAQLRLW